MYDAACLSDPVPLQRAVGDLRVGVKRYEDQTVLDDLRQAGCLKARFPAASRVRLDGRRHPEHRRRRRGRRSSGCRCFRWPRAPGDGFRARRRSDSTARWPGMLRPACGPRCRSTRPRRWSGCRRRRSCSTAARSTAGWRSNMAADARFLGVETLVFGRAAMGETVRQALLRDLIQVRRGGDLAAARRGPHWTALSMCAGAGRDRAGRPRRGDPGLCGAGRGGSAGPAARRRCGPPKPARAPGTACWSPASSGRTAPAVRRTVIAALDGAAGVSSAAAGLAMLIGRGKTP